ncbi:MAG: hypothetical protein M9894_17725 [Planctomycetes bacterium]|nr:hypothetical protein [Planctomycetota bacterium]MCW8141313.1 hypothetical protein [Planctomycetota bacterium]
MAKKKAAKNRPAGGRTGVPLFVYVSQDLRERVEAYQQAVNDGLPQAVRGKFTLSDAVRDLLEKGLAGSDNTEPRS